MKHVFLFCLLIFSLLTFCNCTVEPDLNNVSTNTKTGKEPTQKPETPEPVPPGVVQPETGLLQINELRTEPYLLANSPEYIEFMAMRAGNLNGIRLHITYAEQESFTYTFPSVGVAQGDYITLHLRTLEKTNVDELGEDISEWRGNDTSSAARDLWVPGNNKRLVKTGIVYLQDADGKIMDAIVMKGTPGSAWDTDTAYFAGVTENLYNCGMWKSSNGQKPSPLDAVDTSAVTSSAISVSRYEGRENTHSAKDWYITAYNGLTPGMPNQ
jgi:hypothetical protein